MPVVIVERHEDMSPTGVLRLCCQPDGDVIVSVTDEDGNEAQIEFCASGGRSPKTLQALRDLATAMTGETESIIRIGG